LEYKGNEGELDKILEEIALLASTVNLGSVQSEANLNKTAASRLQQAVDSVSAHSAGINQDLDTLTNKMDKKSKMTKENVEKIEKLDMENIVTKESIDKVFVC
jgi:hypothetical protein